MPWQGGYKTANKDGAAKGWEEKKAIWASKDYDTEYSIAVSQAINVSYESGGGSNKEIFAIFKQILDCKLDKQFREEFTQYYTQKMGIKARGHEKADERMADAEHTVSDFGDDDKLL